jgi:hypothetical protein
MDKELCKKSNCIPHMFDDTGNTIRCDNYDINQCFEPTHDDMKFFRVIDWDKLNSIMKDEMNNFMNHLNNLFKTDSFGFKSLVLSVYPGIIARINGNELFFKVTDLVSGNNKKCNDINYSFSIECQFDNTVPPPSTASSVSKSTTQPTQGFRLFHIAVHSEKPKYFSIDNGGGPITRSMYTCGYFPKPTSTSTPSSGTESGAFHYKIDNYGLLESQKKINRTSCDTKLDENKCPFKKFVPSGTTGRFMHRKSESFENLNFQSNFDINRQINFIKLHSFIYEEFVKFWNNTILPNVFNPSSAAKKIQSVTRAHQTRKRVKRQQNRTKFDAKFPKKFLSKARSNPTYQSKSKKNFRLLSNPTFGGARNRNIRLSNKRNKMRAS